MKIRTYRAAIEEMSRVNAKHHAWRIVAAAGQVMGVPEITAHFMWSRRMFTLAGAYRLVSYR